MVINVQTRQAYSEVDEFLEILSEEQRNEIPKKLREFFKKQKDKEYVKNISAKIPIKKQNLKEETLAIIALLNLQYWCKDEDEKKRLKAVYAQNERMYQEKLYERYNPNDIFKNNHATTVNKEENLPMVVKSENLFSKIINIIKNFLKK